MEVKDFYYNLPPELIAQDPLEDRSSSRLLVMDIHTGQIRHRVFRDIVEYLKPGDCLVVNDTRVIPARLYGVKPGKKCRPGAVVAFGEGVLKGTVLEVAEDGNRLIRFSYEGIFEEILDQLGQMPLPPYITHPLKDKNRYQTIYAQNDGSAAAPTAGLHFTEGLKKDQPGQSGRGARDLCRHHQLPYPGIGGRPGRGFKSRMRLDGYFYLSGIPV